MVILHLLNLLGLGCRKIIKCPVESVLASCVQDFSLVVSYHRGVLRSKVVGLRRARERLRHWLLLLVNHRHILLILLEICRVYYVFCLNLELRLGVDIAGTSTLAAN